MQQILFQKLENKFYTSDIFNTHIIFMSPHLIPVFRRHNNQCEFYTCTNNSNKFWCNENPVLNVGFQDLLM